ncbi:MAG: hypothetical protein QM760_17905 [Nibricoccus sp.]
MRLEASDDLLVWETIQEEVNAPAGDPVHFVDPDTPGRKQRFYRLVPAQNPAGM